MVNQHFLFFLAAIAGGIAYGALTPLEARTVVMRACLVAWLVLMAAAWLCS